MKSLLDGYSWLLLVKMLLLFHLNISGRERRKVSLTLEPRWSLTPVPLPWPISCQRNFVEPLNIEAAQQQQQRSAGKRSAKGAELESGSNVVPR
jgi:hypothetical protein